jgi:hypothetical protein
MPLPTLTDVKFTELLNYAIGIGVPGFNYGSPNPAAAYAAYLDRKNHFDHFIPHIPNGEIQYLMIAEAPPPPNSHTYFYRPEHIGATPWFYAPRRYFCCDGRVGHNKEDCLSKIGSSGGILLDIFPFPIGGVNRNNPNYTALMDYIINQYFCHFVLPPILDEEQGLRLNPNYKLALMGTLVSNRVFADRIPHHACLNALLPQAGVTAPIPRPAFQTSPFRPGVIFPNAIAPGPLGGLPNKCFASATNGPHIYLLAEAFC